MGKRCVYGGGGGEGKSHFAAKRRHRASYDAKNIGTVAIVDQTHNTNFVWGVLYKMPSASGFNSAN